MNQADLLANLGLDTSVKEDEVRAGGAAPAIPKGTYGYRLVGVVETGAHPSEWQGQVKTKHPINFIFQLLGKQLPEWKDKDGKDIPRTMTIYSNKSFTKNGGYLPLFNALNHEGKAINAFQLLGSSGRLKVVEYQKKDGKTGVKIDPGSISAPVIEVMDEDGNSTGEFKKVNIPEATADFQVFQWSTGNQAQFDTLPFFLQEEITQAMNFAETFPNGFVMKENPRNRREGGEETEEASATEKNTTATAQQNKKPAADDFDADDIPF